MHKLKRGIVLWFLLILMMTFVGCKGKSQTDDKKEAAIVYHKAAKTDEGDLKLDAVVMSVGNIKVPYKEVIIYMYQLKEQYEPNLGQKIWSYELEDKKTFEQYAKEEVISEITQLKIICQKAEEKGIVLDDDEKDEINKYAKEYVTNLPEKDREKYGITEELMVQLYSENQLASKMFAITTNSVNTNISDEEAKQIKIQYLMVMTNGEDKNGREVDMSADEKINARKRAIRLLKEAKAAESFYSFAEANTDDSSLELTFGKEDMPSEFGQEAFQLKTGEISNLIETDSGYYILYCASDFDKDATTMKKENIIEENQNKLFESTYAEWAKQFEIAISTSLWDQIHFIKQ